MPKKYVVANPRKHPKGTPIFQQGDRLYYEGDVYDGDNVKGAMPYLVEVKGG